MTFTDSVSPSADWELGVGAWEGRLTFLLVPEFCDISPFPGGGGRDTVVSLQPGGKRRAWGLCPAGRLCVVDFQEAPSP